MPISVSKFVWRSKIIGELFLFTQLTQDFSTFLYLVVHYHRSAVF